MAWMLSLPDLLALAGVSRRFGAPNSVALSLAQADASIDEFPVTLALALMQLSKTKNSNAHAPRRSTQSKIQWNFSPHHFYMPLNKSNFATTLRTFGCWVCVVDKTRAITISSS